MSFVWQIYTEQYIVSKYSIKQVIALINVAVIGGAAYFGVNRMGLIKPQSVPVNLAQDQVKENNPTGDIVNPSGEYTINELLTMNKPLKCTWKDSAAGDKDVSNIIYINGKKFYQDVTMGDIGHSFTVSDGDYLYIWNDFNDMASKIKNTGEKLTQRIPIR
jgi:hypothetical protein